MSDPAQPSLHELTPDAPAAPRRQRRNGAPPDETAQSPDARQIDWNGAPNPVHLSGAPLSPVPPVWHTAETAPDFIAPPIQPTPARPTPAERDRAIDALLRLLDSHFEHISLGAAAKLLDLDPA